MARPERRDLGRPRGAVMTAVASSALAGVAVLALVGVLILAFGQDGPSARELRAQERAADPGLTAVPASAVLTPGGESSPAARPAPPEPTPTAEPTPSGDPLVGSVAVAVLNQTTRVGLAATFGRVLEQGGWTVRGIGDFRGNVPATTVYYPPGSKAAARALADQFDEVNRIRPAFAGIPTNRLTVILGKDYPPG